MSINAGMSAPNAYYYGVESQLITIDTAFNGNMDSIKAFVLNKTNLSGSFAGFSYLNEKTNFAQNEVPVYNTFGDQGSSYYAYRYRDGRFTRLTSASLSTTYDAYIPAGTQIVVYAKTVHTPGV